MYFPYYPLLFLSDCLLIQCPKTIPKTIGNIGTTINAIATNAIDINRLGL